MIEWNKEDSNRRIHAIQERRQREWENATKKWSASVDTRVRSLAVVVLELLCVIGHEQEWRVIENEALVANVVSLAVVVVGFVRTVWYVAVGCHTHKPSQWNGVEITKKVNGFE